MFTDWLFACSKEIQNLFYLVSMAVGGILGPYYFYGRILFENNRDKRDRARKRSEQILGYFLSYDEQLQNILCLKITNQEDLSRIREKISRIYAIIQNHLERDEKSLNFSDSEFQTILSLFSFAEKNELFKSTPFEELTNQKRALKSITDYYNGLFIEVHRVVLSRTTD
ncbi:MAG: hypothetical protein HY559_00485 [Gammaproteobacteria bacterium]|nr:hypothetical protein [Gammaproteobacteria bacterium]